MQSGSVSSDTYINSTSNEMMKCGAISGLSGPGGAAAEALDDLLDDMRAQAAEGAKFVDVRMAGLDVAFEPLVRMRVLEVSDLAATPMC